MKNALEIFGQAIGRAANALGIADELIAEAHAECNKSVDLKARRREISEIRRAAGAKGKETRKSRAAAGGAY